LQECIPEQLIHGSIHEFLKEGQRNYWLEGEIPLIETDGNKLSMPIASILILEATHFIENNKLFTKGKYKIIEVFTDKNAHFNGFSKI